MPDTPETTSRFDDLCREPFLPQPVQQIYTCKATANNHSIELQMLRPGLCVTIAIRLAVRSFIALLPRSANLSLQGGNHDDDKNRTKSTCRVDGTIKERLNMLATLYIQHRHRVTFFMLPTCGNLGEWISATCLSSSREESCAASVDPGFAGRFRK